MSINLNGLGVLITRPHGQAQRLARTIRDVGGEPLLFPTIEIADIENPQPALTILGSLKQFDRAIFISTNAVEKTFTLMSPTAWSADLPVAAIGSATAEALRAFGVKNVLSPVESFDSEALLALPELLSVNNLRIVIFRGQGGRETLKQILVERGADVTYCECYRRIKPAVSNTLLLEWLEQKKIRAIDVMSGESLENLLELAGESARQLKKITLITHHARVAQLAKVAGFSQVLTCAASDRALMPVLEGLSLGKL